MPACVEDSRVAHAHTGSSTDRRDWSEDLPEEGELISIHPGLQLQRGVLPKRGDNESEEQGDAHKHSWENDLQTTQKQQDDGQLKFILTSTWCFSLKVSWCFIVFFTKCYSEITWPLLVSLIQCSCIATCTPECFMQYYASWKLNTFFIEVMTHTGVSTVESSNTACQFIRTLCGVYRPHTFTFY